MTNQMDADCLHWASQRGCDALYKDIPVGGLFKFRPEDTEVYRKKSRGFKLADGSNPHTFQTGARTGVVSIAE